MVEEFPGGRKDLDEAIDKAIARDAATKKRKGLPAPKVGMDRAKAEAMAANLDEYDSKIVAGRLTG